MSSKRLGLLALVVTAMIVAACQPATDQSQVATLQAQLAAAEQGSGNADAVATLQAQLTQAAAAGPATEALPSFNPTFKDETSYVFYDIGDPETLDPAVHYDTASSDAIRLVYDFLIFYKGSSVTEFAPMLAEKWEVSADGLTYTFNIRKDVKFPRRWRS